MPPFVARKRHRSTSPVPTPASKRVKTGPSPLTKRAKPTLSHTLDAPTRAASTPEETNAFLRKLNKASDTDDDYDDDSSLSEVSSADFEDVLPGAPPKRHRNITHGEQDAQKGGHSDEEEDENMDWEDATAVARPAKATAEHEIADLSISLDENGVYIPSASTKLDGKRGPTKKERQVRISTHCLHVQFLMWHNALRNSWLNNTEVQKTLVDALPEDVRKEVERWRVSMGMQSLDKPNTNDKKGAKGVGKGKSKRERTKGKEKEKRRGRDWGATADRLEAGAINMSAGDPLLRLLKILTAYWRKRFTVTAPGLRKQGYKDLRRLREEIKALQRDEHDPEEHGERIRTVDEYKVCAKTCVGSRDAGAQLFTALLRGLGLESRMVTNLQPAGFGWSKGEEAAPKKGKTGKQKVTTSAVVLSDSEGDPEEDKNLAKRQRPSVKAPKPSVAMSKLGKAPARKSARGIQSAPIDLDGSDSALSSPPSDIDSEDEDGDDALIIGKTSSTPGKKNLKKFDRDLAFPVYWTEVLSPISNTYIPVDPIVLSTVASNEELLATFEPRGKQADKTKQVIAYVLAHAADGSAKDVTVRYLKRHQLPGKTKGIRVPVEKVPIYNKRGKVRHYEQYDWFKTVMSGYERPAAKRTPADEIEDATVLKPFKPSTEKAKPEAETLQGYKSSAEFVLERHLRREEAILPHAKAVKLFALGKGDKAEEIPVFRRADVVACKTAESWHKEGREILHGAQPMKMVPVRAVTLIRK
ncbi:hypothetical protein LTR66_011567, partial [Elasticomyces elasticus]